MERLTNSNEEIKTLQAENEAYWLNVYFKLKEYEDLEEQGLLLKLPFKIGDTLYYIDDYEIYHDKVYSIEVTEVNGEHTFCVGCMDWIYDDFGKTVFLTKEEAEEALRKKVE